MFLKLDSLIRSSKENPIRKTKIREISIISYY